MEQNAKSIFRHHERQVINQRHESICSPQELMSLFHVTGEGWIVQRRPEDKG